MTTPINISDEARECARNESAYAFRGHHIQLLLDKRDAELQSLRRDKERLDWLDGVLSVEQYNELFGENHSEHYGEIRQAIDKEMSK